MDIAERLLAIKNIESLKARYCRLLDTKQWPEWAALFAEDAVMDLRDDVPPDLGNAIIAGRQTIVAQVRRLVGAARTVHQVHAPEIELEPPRLATGVWAMQDVVIWADAAASPLPGTTSVRGFGHYHETYELQGGRWLIKSLKLTRLLLDIA
jgi:hypothetical protein